MAAPLGSDPSGISNDMMSSGAQTFHVCHRCIGAFANGELKVFGKIGCTMPDIEGSEELYACWKAAAEDGEEVQYGKCLRCWYMREPCLAVSE
jgi:hypothetical protein